MDKITLIYAIFVFLANACTVIPAIKAFFKEDLISSLNTSEYKKNKLYQHEKLITTVAKIILAAFIIVSLVYVLVPTIIDFPRIFTGNFEKSICTIQYSYEYKTDLWVNLITDKGEKISLMVLDNSYKRSEKYLVYYLPHLKYGTLVSI